MPLAAAFETGLLEVVLAAVEAAPVLATVVLAAETRVVGEALELVLVVGAADELVVLEVVLVELADVEEGELELELELELEEPALELEPEPESVEEPPAQPPVDLMLCQLPELSP
jgi:hypothetical protein